MTAQILFAAILFAALALIVLVDSIRRGSLWTAWRATDDGQPVDYFKRAMDLITLLVIIGGLWFAYDQAEKLERAIESHKVSVVASNWASISAETAQVDKVFVDYPELVPYFFEKQDLPKAEAQGVATQGAVAGGSQDQRTLHNRLTAAAAMLLDYLDTVAANAAFFGKEGTHNIIDEDVWIRYTRALFDSSPFLCRYYKDNKDYYGAALKAWVPASCKT